LYSQSSALPRGTLHNRSDTDADALTTSPADADPHTYDSRESNLMTWRNRAACLDEDPELFFPIGNTGPALLQIEEAKAVCRRCEVVETCLKWAIESGQDAGVWGGLSEDERRALKRRNARARRAG
jgi:WhiB family redox-sensing transcriptional regulator